MNIAHIAVVTPKRCGLYETTRELVAAEIQLGHDARIVDPKVNKELHPRTEDDRGAKLEPVEDYSFALEADIVINHSGMDLPELKAVTAPVIYVSHGRPYSSFMGEVNGGTPVYSYYVRSDREQRFNSVITLWEEHLPYLRAVFTNTPVHYINSTVDLTAWNPDGPTGYDFGGNRGQINLVITDPWRSDINPFLSINAAILFCKRWPGSKLHIYGADNNRRGFESLFYVLKEMGALGEVNGWTLGLENVYRAADVMITPHRIDTRSIRESKACGCQVVSAQDCDPYDIQETAIKIATKILEPEDTREQAELYFSPETAAVDLISICEKYTNMSAPKLGVPYGG
jgi:glycosyltransferase involved in cell wall biosynthesis